jgi:hypothetical protein
MNGWLDPFTTFDATPLGEGMVMVDGMFATVLVAMLVVVFLHVAGGKTSYKTC